MPGDHDAFVERHLRHNLVALGADYALFMVGLSFASQSTILPAFAEHLRAPNVVIGAIPAVMTVGWWLPSLFAAGHTETLARRLPFVLRYTILERTPFVVLALAAFFLAERAPGLALALLLVMLLVITGAGGALMPAWMDVVGRTIPTTLRGRFFAVASVGANAGALLGSFGTAYILAAVRAPWSYGVCFLTAAVFMGLSYVALALTREPPAVVTSPPVSLGAYLSRIPGLLRRDRNLTWFLAARAFAVIGMMASGFYTVYALRTLGAASWHVGVFTTVFLAGQIAGNVVFGGLADRAGHRLVIMIGVAATVTANVVALAGPSLPLFSVVFALSGVHVAAINVSSLNVLLEFAPGMEERPTYVGLGTTSLAPLAFAAPLLAGLMVDALGFESVFGLAALFGLVGLSLLLTRVRDPRHQPESVAE
ncbi:MAG: MFS transporter [Candidatus Rokubacteria bacterium]|nr:MFS transporter [Candidatus Rokubacteria bacterium]